MSWMEFLTLIIVVCDIFSLIQNGSFALSEWCCKRQEVTWKSHSMSWQLTPISGRRFTRGAKLTVYATVTPVEKVYRSSVGSVEKRRTIEKARGNKLLSSCFFPFAQHSLTPFRSGSHGGVCKVFTRRGKLSIIKGIIILKGTPVRRSPLSS